MSALKYWIWLCQRKGLRSQTRLAPAGALSARRRISTAPTGGAAAHSGHDPGTGGRFGGQGSVRRGARPGGVRRRGSRFLTMQDADYPDRLRNIYDPPCLLYCRGRLPAMDEEAAVAVVGTRRATPYGLSGGGALGFELAAGGAAAGHGYGPGHRLRGGPGRSAGGGTGGGRAGQRPGRDLPAGEPGIYMRTWLPPARCSASTRRAPSRPGIIFPCATASSPGCAWPRWWWRRRRRAAR
jgi:DNA processing protein